MDLRHERQAIRRELRKQLRREGVARTYGPRELRRQVKDWTRAIQQNPHQRRSALRVIQEATA